MPRSLLLALGLGLIQLAIGSSLARAAEGEWPEGFEVRENTISPNGRYGVLLPDYDHASAQEEEIDDVLVNLKTHKRVTVIRNAHYFRGRNHSGFSVTWGPDSDRCVVVVDSRYGFGTITVMELRDGAWAQLDLGKAVQKGLDAGISQQAKGPYTGSYGMPHFRFAPGRKLLVRATSYTNPKGFPDQPTYNAFFQGTFDLSIAKWTRSESRGIENGDDFDFAFTDRLGEGNTFDSEENRLSWYDARLNEVYAALRTTLPAARFATAKKEQIAWLKQLEAKESIADKCQFIGARIKQLRELLW